MSDEALNKKYQTLASEVLPQTQVEELAAAVWELDDASDVSDISRLMQIIPKSSNT
jgi:hypothetical protein